MRVFFGLTIAVVHINAEIISYSSNDPGLKRSLILYDGSFDHCKSLDCRHGRCEPMEQICVCDIGWTGQLCDKTSSDQPGTISSDVNPTRQQVKDKPDRSRISEQLNMINAQKRHPAHEPVVRQRPRERLFVEISDGVGNFNKALPSFKRYDANFVHSNAFDKPSENTFWDSATSMTYDSIPKGSTWINLGLIGSPQYAANYLLSHDFRNPANNVIVHSYDINSFTATVSQDACSSSYKLRPRDDRMCQFGFRCMYGSCSSDYSLKQITFQCKCDPGAMGLFCENKCCLNCGQNGQCDVKPDGTQFCFCRRGYTGQNCEISVY